MAQKTLSEPKHAAARLARSFGECVAKAVDRVRVPKHRRAQPSGTASFVMKGVHYEQLTPVRIPEYCPPVEEEQPTSSTAADRWEAAQACAADMVAFSRLNRDKLPHGDIHAELFAKLEQKAVGRPRTIELYVGLYNLGVAWCREHGVLSEVAIRDMVCWAAAACMQLLPSELALASFLDTRGGQLSLEDANRIAAGRFGLSIWERICRWFTPRVYSNSRGAHYVLSTR